jgi:hypothetical protein
MDSLEAARLFDAYYYAHGCGPIPYQHNDTWMSFFRGVSGQIVSEMLPQARGASVLDAGCAWGFLVEALRERDVQAYGIDISEYAIQNVQPAIRPYCWIGSITEPFPQRYDLITCIEVLEHIPAQDARRAVENLCRHTEDILFSSSPFDYKEVTHFNVQPPEYWAELFAQQGFYRDVDFDAGFLTSWAVRYRRRSEPLARIVRDYERRYFLLWKENSDLRSLSIEMRDRLAGLDQNLHTLKEQLAEKEQNVVQLQGTSSDLHRKLAELSEELDELRRQLANAFSTRS